jgi:hypothetical protein
MDYIKKYRDVTVIMWQLEYHSINPGFEYALYVSQKHCSYKDQAKLFLCSGNFIKANTQIISLIF